MWPPEDALGHRSSLQSLKLGSASSTESLEELLSEFEVVNCGVPPPAKQLNVLPARLSGFHLPALFRGRPPRPATLQQVTSQPYQSTRRSHRRQNAGPAEAGLRLGREDDGEQQELLFQSDLEDSAEQAVFRDACSSARQTEPPAAAELPEPVQTGMAHARGSAAGRSSPMADDSAAQVLLSTPLAQLVESHALHGLSLGPAAPERLPAQSQHPVEPHQLGLMPCDDSDSHHSPASSLSSPVSPLQRLQESGSAWHHSSAGSPARHPPFRQLSWTASLHTAEAGSAPSQSGFQGMLPALKQVLQGPAREAGSQIRQPGLRKRDFESELLDRLLNNPLPAVAGQPSFSPPPKPPPEVGPQKGGLRRSIGAHRILFITTVFAIMALFLLIFTNGRMHAQRAMRLGVALVPTVPVALSDLPRGDASGSAAAKHHHMPLPQPTSLPTAIREAEAAATGGIRVEEEGRLHDRSNAHAGPVDMSQMDSLVPIRQADRKRSSVGLKLLQVDIRGLT